MYGKKILFILIFKRYLFIVCHCCLSGSSQIFCRGPRETRRRHWIRTGRSISDRILFVWPFQLVNRMHGGHGAQKTHAPLSSFTRRIVSSVRRGKTTDDNDRYYYCCYDGVARLAKKFKKKKKRKLCVLNVFFY